MTNKKLSHYFSLQRRYSRSINLERDLDSVEALEGYVLTKRAIDSLKRIFSSFNSDEGNRAWTLTSVYGTGKSAFAHYLISLVAKSRSKIHIKALAIAEDKLGEDSEIYQLIQDNISPSGLIRAVATGQREPISHTIIRALLTGVENFWTASQRNRIDAVGHLVDLEAARCGGSPRCSDCEPEGDMGLLPTISKFWYVFAVGSCGGFLFSSYGKKSNI